MCVYCTYTVTFVGVSIGLHTHIYTCLPSIYVCALLRIDINKGFTYQPIRYVSGFWLFDTDILITIGQYKFILSRFWPSDTDILITIGQIHICITDTDTITDTMI